MTEKAIVLFIVLFFVAMAAWFVHGARKERQWVAQAISEGCRVVNHVGSHAQPQWSCPDRGLVLQPNP